MLFGPSSQQNHKLNKPFSLSTSQLQEQEMGKFTPPNLNIQNIGCSFLKEDREGHAEDPGESWP
jgi:hypothetical protein